MWGISIASGFLLGLIVFLAFSNGKDLSFLLCWFLATSVVRVLLYFLTLTTFYKRMTEKEKR